MTGKAFSGVGIGHRHNHLRASCAMERERLLGAAAPVLEASTSGFALDGVVRPRRDRARLAGAVAALLGCAAFAGSSLSGASVAALGDGGPAQSGLAGAPNAWGTKHNALPWWTRPAAVNARRQASLGMYEGMKEETTFNHLANGEFVKSETRELSARTRSRRRPDVRRTIRSRASRKTSSKAQARRPWPRRSRWRAWAWPTGFGLRRRRTTRCTRRRRRNAPRASPLGARRARRDASGKKLMLGG